MVRIRPLTQKRLNDAVNLLNDIFPGEEEEPPSMELPASLSQAKYRDDYLLRTGKSAVKYWVAVSGDVVAGVIGLFCYERDKDEAFWLGWFGVRPACRRAGIGEKLLRFIIKKARKERKKFLRLDTSTDPNELSAHRLYEKYGFKLTGSGPYLNDTDIEKLYYELKL